MPTAASITEVRKFAVSERRGNPDVSNTAARYVAKAMARVAPWQRSELLAAMADIVADASAHIGGVA